MIVQLLSGKKQARRLARAEQYASCSACRADVAQAVIRREMQYGWRFA